MRPISRAVSATALVLATCSLTAGCGGGDSSAPSESESSTVGSPEESGSAGDDGGGDGGDGELLGICSLVTGAEVAQVVGGALTASPIPGGGCAFAQDEDVELPSVSLGEQAYSEDNGGLQGARSGLESIYTGGTSTELDLGEGAVVVTGAAFGGESIKGSGLVHLGDTLVQVDLGQGSDYPEPKVKQLVTDVLTLVASKG